MAEKAGLGGFLAVKSETTPGTYAAPTAGKEFNSESFERNNAYIRRSTIQSGVIAQKDNQHSQTTRDAGGELDLDMLGNGMGWLLNLLHGNVVTPSVVVAATVWKQTHNIGLISPNGKAVSIQVARPDVGGTLNTFSYLGGKATQVVFTLEKGGVVNAKASMDFMDEDVTKAIVTPVYDDLARPLIFQGASIEFDDVVLTDCVESATVTFTIPMKTDRYCIGSGATKKEQITNGPVACSIDLNMEFASMAQHLAYRNATRRKFEFNCDGVLIDATNKQHMYITVAKTVTTKASQPIAGPDVIAQSVTLEAVQNGVTPLASIEYQSADSAID